MPCRWICVASLMIRPARGALRVVLAVHRPGTSPRRRGCASAAPSRCGWAAPAAQARRGEQVGHRRPVSVGSLQRATAACRSDSATALSAWRMRGWMGAVLSRPRRRTNLKKRSTSPARPARAIPAQGGMRASGLDRVEEGIPSLFPSVSSGSRKSTRRMPSLSMASAPFIDARAAPLVFDPVTDRLVVGGVPPAATLFARGNLGRLSMAAAACWDRGVAQGLASRGHAKHRVIRLRRFS